jgi:hypothetical protein
MNRWKVRVGYCLGVFTLLICVAGPSTAEIVRFNFTGVVTSNLGNPFGLNASLGETVEGSFTYDAPPFIPGGSGFGGFIQPPPSGMSIVVLGTRLRSQDFNSFQTINDLFGVDSVNGFFTPILVAGVSQPFPSSMFFALTDTTMTALASTVLPTDLSASSFNIRTGSMSDSATGASLSFSIDTLSKVEYIPSLLTALSPVSLSIGLKNSDDQGAQFDVRVEILKNDVPVAAGLHRCVTGVTRNPANATEVLVTFDPISPLLMESGDVLKLRVSARIGTNLDGTKCLGPGGSHNSATGLRLYYGSVSRPSGFDVTITPLPSKELFLQSDGGACINAPSKGVTTRVLDDTAPSATSPKCKDSGPVSFSSGNPFREVGTWNVLIP